MLRTLTTLKVIFVGPWARTRIFTMVPLTGDFARPDWPGKYEPTCVQDVKPRRPMSSQVCPALAGSWFRLEPNQVVAAEAPEGATAAARAAAAARVVMRVVKEFMPRASATGEPAARDPRCGLGHPLE